MKHLIRSLNFTLSATIWSTFTLISMLSFSQDSLLSYDTDWLSPEVGFTETKLGVRIDSVTEIGAEGLQRIAISLPATSMQIEEVIVIGKRIDPPQRITQQRRFEYINDPETGRHGLVIYIGKQQQFALKFNYFEGNARFPYH